VSDYSLPCPQDWVDMGKGTSIIILLLKLCLGVCDISCGRCLRCSRGEHTCCMLPLFIFMFMFPFSCTTITGLRVLLSCMKAVALSSF
jgi:hypothetical protein